MRKISLLVAIVLTLSLSAQNSIKDSFDSNKLGWSEMVRESGSALIQNGVFNFDNKIKLINLLTLTTPQPVLSTCWAPLDVTKDFQLKVHAMPKRLTTGAQFAILVDYLDDYNYCAFYISEYYAMYQRVQEGRLICQRIVDIKTSKKKNTKYSIELKSTFNKLEFIVDGMKVIEQRYVKLESNGIGLALLGASSISFDNFEIIQ